MDYSAGLGLGKGLNPRPSEHHLSLPKMKLSQFNKSANDGMRPSL